MHWHLTDNGVEAPGVRTSDEITWTLEDKHERFGLSPCESPIVQDPGNPNTLCLRMALRMGLVVRDGVVLHAGNT